MNFYHQLMGMALIASSLSAQAALYSPQCPKEIKTQQQLLTSIPTWEYLGDSRPNALKAVSFYSGHPRKQASLKPEFINKKQSKWDFSPQDTIYLVCHYQDTILTLTQALPEKTTHCMVDYSLQLQGDNGALPEKVTCLKE